MVWRFIINSILFIPSFFLNLQTKMTHNSNELKRLNCLAGCCLIHFFFNKTTVVYNRVYRFVKNYFRRTYGILKCTSPRKRDKSVHKSVQNDNIAISPNPRILSRVCFSTCSTQLFQLPSIVTYTVWFESRSCVIPTIIALCKEPSEFLV